MAVTHTGGGDLSIIERLLLARDRREVVLSPELMEAELLMLSWLDGPRLTNDYEMELLLGDDGIVTVENKATIATPRWCRFLIAPISFRVQWRTTFPGFLG